MSKKKKNVAKTVFKLIGIASIVAIVVGVICYFKVPEFQTYINNSWQDFVTKVKELFGNKESVDETVEAAKHLFIR